MLSRSNWSVSAKKTSDNQGSLNAIKTPSLQRSNFVFQRDIPDKLASKNLPSKVVMAKYKNRLNISTLLSCLMSHTGWDSCRTCVFICGNLFPSILGILCSDIKTLNIISGMVMSPLIDCSKAWSKNHEALLVLCGAGIAEWVSALDWLSLRYAAIITLPVSTLYHTCFICGQRCKWWSRRPKLTSSVISDIKPIIYIYFFLHMHRNIIK